MRFGLDMKAPALEKPNLLGVRLIGVRNETAGLTVAAGAVVLNCNEASISETGQALTERIKMELGNLDFF